jgi:hypothetical protein
MSMPVGGEEAAFVGVQHVLADADGRNARARVSVRPSRWWSCAPPSRPANANTNAPEQIGVMRSPRRCVRVRASSSACGGRSHVSVAQHARGPWDAASVVHPRMAWIYVVPRRWIIDARRNRRPIRLGCRTCEAAGAAEHGSALPERAGAVPIRRWPQRAL